VRDGLTRTALADLGQALLDAKKTAPTHPHPRSPDTPPGNSVAGTISGVIDRVGDNISGIAQGGVNAAQDVIARIMKSNKPKVSPTGSTVARTTANNVRHSTAAAVDGVEQTARTMKAGATKTMRAASTGAKGTVTTAKKSARSTATTAKRAARTTGRTARKSARATTSTAKRAASKTRAAATASR